MVDEQKEDPAALGWEQNYLDALEAQDEADSTWKVIRQADRSFGDEFGSTIEGDLALLQVAILAIVIYTYFAISKWDDGIVGSRFLLTLGGIANIGLAIIACYGFCSYIGLLFTPLMSILPFIMLGVGVDGMFVLQGALQITDKEDPMSVRMSETMRHGGVSVFVASLTNFGAFMIGSNTTLPALSAFSIYAAIGLLFNLLLQITFFSAVMCLDRKREERRAMDFLVCIKSSAPENQGLCCGAIKPSKTGKRAKVMGWLGLQYTKLPVKIAVICAWIALLAVGIYGTSQMRVEADVNNFIPEGSYLQDWINTLQSNFDTTGTEVKLYWVGKCNAETGTNCDPQPDIDFTDPVIQGQMDTSLQLLADNDFVVASSIDSFWTALKAFNNGTSPAGDFYPLLNSFLAGPGRKYAGDIRLSDADGSLLIAATTFSLKYLEDTAAQVNALDAMRDFEAAIPDPLGINAFTHAGDFLDFEQYKSIGRELVLNIGLGFVMIAIIILLLVGNPVASLLTFLCVASSIVELVGFMYFRDTFIDSISVIFLVISLGLAVDYSVHVAHGYLVAREPDPVARMQSTMANTGVAVINGAVSTLIAALCLSGSGSYVFITFFFALLFIVLCGAFQGLVVLPVLLDFVRPSAHEDTNKSHPAPIDLEADTNPSQ